MKARLFIFDLDNTLVITSPAAKHAYKQAINHLAKMEGRDHDNKKLYNHWKKIVQQVLGEKKPQLRRFEYSLNELIRLQDLNPAHAATALHIYEKELLKMLEPNSGARDILSWLKDLGHTVVVSTGSGKNEAKKKLDATQLSQYVDFLVTSDDVDSMKPNQAFILEPIKLAKATKDSTLVIGDSKQEDIEPAESLGIKSLMIKPGKHHLNELRNEIEQWLLAIN
jgi:putative hydrolase of the HAD superfamily